MTARLLIRGARVLDPGGGLDEPGDVLVADGRIEAVGRMAPPAPGPDLEELDARGLLLTPGLVDIHVHLREPGQEHKEDIGSGTAAAVAGGFTTVCCMPNTSPPNDCVEVTGRIMARAREVGRARVYPIAAITKGQAGEELVDLGALKGAGAVAISDDGRAVARADVMRQALERAQAVGLPLVQHCEDSRLSRGAPLHDCAAAKATGLACQPASAEEVVLARDLVLCAETGARYHAAHVSTAGSVELIRWAKERGLEVTAEVTVHHLALTVEATGGLDPNTKCNPPLRTEADRQACLAGVREGVIDAVVTDHAPHTEGEKAVGFAEAPFGVIGLETALPVGLGLVARGELDLATLIRCLTSGPCAALGLPGGRLAPGAPADLTLIDLRAGWIIEPERFCSRSRNTPFAGWEVTGRAACTVVAGRVVYRWPAG